MALKQAPDESKKRKPGKPKGATNRHSLAAREWFQAKDINLIEQVLVRLPKLAMVDQVAALIRLFPYVYPKLSSITVESKTPEQIELEKMSTEELYEKVKTIIIEKEQFTAIKDTITQTSEVLNDRAVINRTLDFKPNRLSESGVRGTVHQAGRDNATAAEIVRDRILDSLEDSGAE